MAVKNGRVYSTDPPKLAPGAQRFNLSSLWQDEYPRFRKSRERIAQAGKLRRGEMQPHVPADVENADAFRITIPHGLLMVQNIVQYLTRKQPGVRRPSGPGPKAVRLASKVEKWLGAPGKGGALGELRTQGEMLWEAFVAHGANNGEYAVRVLPKPAAWSHLLAFAQDEEEDDTGGTKVHPYFVRDAKGRDPEDAFYENDPHAFELDMVASQRAYDEYDAHEKARSLPFVVEVLHPDTVLPIGVDPATGKVDAMLIRTVRSVRSLKSLGFDWDVLSHADAPEEAESNTVSPSSALLGGGQQVTLYELMVPGGIYYQVGDNVNPDGSTGKVHPTYLRRASADGTTERVLAYVNLAKTYGITEVPGGYFYGCHHPSEADPDKRGIPLLTIFASLIMGANQTISSIVHHAYSVGFGGWFADPSGVDPKYWTEANQPMKVTVKRGSVSYIAGKITPAVHSGVDKDIQWFVQMALGLLESFGPSSALTSGDSSDGGFSQAVAQASGENAIAQILNGAMSALKRTCECLLEQTAALSDMLGEPIPIYCRYDPKDKTYHELLKLSADDLAGDWTIEVIFPMKKGSNLPLAQGMFQWWKGGALSLYTWLQDGWGEEHPDEEVDRINVEKALQSEQGQKLVWQLAARIQGDREMAKIAGLQQEGKLGPGGTPSALMPPKPGPMGMSDGGVPPGSAGVEVGNPLVSAMGGMMAGQMQTAPQAAVTAATGAPVPTAPQGGVPI